MPPKQTELNFDAQPAAPSQGAALRDEGTKRVMDRAGEEWASRCMTVIRQSLGGQEATGEDCRLLCEQHGIYAHHPNAWGALMLRMKKAGIIKATGEWRSPRDKKSHARPTKVYVIQH